MASVKKGLAIINAAVEDRRTALIIILIPGTAIRLLMLLGQPAIIWPDSIAYYEWALRIAEGSAPLGHPIYRTIGYPAFLSLFFIHGETPAAITGILAVQHFLGLCSVVLLYFLARSAFGAWTAFLSALTFGLYPLQLYYETVIQTEVLFVFFLLLLVFYFARWINNLTVQRSVVIGLLLVFVTLTRPIGQLVVLILFAALYFETQSLRKTVKSALIVGGVYILGITPWCAANYSTYGFFAPSRDIGVNFFHRVYDVDVKQLPENNVCAPLIGLAEHHLRRGQPLFMNLYADLLKKKLPPIQADQTLMGCALAGVSFDRTFAVNSARVWLNLFFHPNRSMSICSANGRSVLCALSAALPLRAVLQQAQERAVWAETIVLRFFSTVDLPIGLLSILAVLSVVASLRHPRLPKPVLFIAVSLILYFSLLTAIFNREHDRFRLPADPFLIMLAVLFVVQVCRAAAQKGWAGTANLD